MTYIEVNAWRWKCDYWNCHKVSDVVVEGAIPIGWLSVRVPPENHFCCEDHRAKWLSGDKDPFPQEVHNRAMDLVLSNKGLGYYESIQVVLREIEDNEEVVGNG